MSLPAAKSQREQRIFAAIAAGGTPAAGVTWLPFGGLWRRSTAVGTWNTNIGPEFSCSGGAGLINRVLVDTGKSRSANPTYAIDLITVPGATGASYGFFFGCTDENNGYIAEVRSGGGNGTLYKFVAGVATSIGSMSSSCVASDTISVSMSSSSMTVNRIRNGVTTALITSTDTTFSSGSMMGPYAYDAVTMVFSNANVA